MARRKKKSLSRADKRRRHRQRDDEAKRQDDVVLDTAARFTCAAETADDFAYQCLHTLEALDIDLLFHRLALEIWNEPPERAQALVVALEELLAERVRYRETLHRIGHHLQTLADDPSFHIHLEPIDAYRELVRSRVFPETTAR